MAEAADAEVLANRAVRAVGRNHVPRAERLLGPAVPGPDGNRHAVVVLLEEDGLGCMLDTRPEPRSGAGQDRLEPDLRHEHARRGADVLDALVDEAEVPVELLPAEAVDGHDRAVLDELARGGLFDRLLQADRAVGLDRALADERGSRVDRRAAVPLEHERRNAVVAQEDRSRQPDEAAADDQDRNVFARHRSAESDRFALLGQKEP